MAAFLITFGCGKKAEVTTPNSKHSQGASAPPSNKLLQIDPRRSSVLRGKVYFKGKVPPPEELPIGGNPECKIFHKNKIYSEDILVTGDRLQNVFVYIKEGLENYQFPMPTEPVKINQTQCLYNPRISGAQVNQTVTLLNNDPTLHNVHSYCTHNSTWNFGMPFEGMEIKQTFSKPEIMVTLKCDLHPWMIGYIGILPHPYFSITGPDGVFELKNLPPGDYVIEAWHEKMGTLTQQVHINAQETKELEFSFELPSK